MRSKVKKRIGLDQAAANALNLIIEDLKTSNKSLKFSDSQFVGAIVEIFSKKYFKKEKFYFEDLFFDKRKALLKLASSSISNQDLETEISKLLKKKKAVSKSKDESFEQG